MIVPPRITAELDAMHAQAKAAFERRDLSEYRELFAPELAYRQADGRVIDRERLMSDVDAQFHSLNWVRSTFVREEIEAEGDRAIEVLLQTASAGTTAFLFIHRTWELLRRGRYTWRKQEGRWRIETVEILEERISPGRLTTGLWPPIAA